MVQYETCLVLPRAYQKEAPKADNPAVYFDEKPERVVVTRRVSGYFITDSAWEEEATSLKTFLKEKMGEVDVDFNGYYRNGYDAPMRIFNRRNEVWYVKTGPAAEKAIQDYKNKLTATEAEAATAATTTLEADKQVPSALYPHSFSLYSIILLSFLIGFQRINPFRISFIL